MSTPVWAVRGAKVVCIADGWDGPDNYPDVAPPAFAPAKGVLLTIDGTDADTFLFFKELPRTYETPLGMGRVSWPIESFRPVVTRTQEQDFALFRPILDHVPETV